MLLVVSFRVRDESSNSLQGEQADAVSGGPFLHGSRGRVATW